MEGLLIIPGKDSFIQNAVPLGAVRPLAPKNSLQSSGIEMERVRREDRASLFLVGQVFGFLRQRILTLKMVLSSQGIAIASLFLGSSQEPSYVYFLSLNNNITIYFWNRDVIIGPVCSPISFTTLLALLCKHFSCFSDIFYFSLKEVAQTLYFYPYAAPLLLQVLSVLSSL